MNKKFIKTDSLLPEYLFKNFEKQEHLENFLSGNIKITQIEKFRQVEDLRKDENENKAIFKYQNGGSKINSEIFLAANPYILSTSGPFSDRNVCRQQFGNYEVKIINPILFKDELNKVWNNNLFALRNINFRKVEYSKGELKKQPVDSIEPYCISTWQKNICYSSEDEYRFVFFIRADYNQKMHESFEMKICPNGLFR